jgi:hypothetical protein
MRNRRNTLAAFWLSFVAFMFIAGDSVLAADKLVIRSKDWINPQVTDITATVSITQLSPRAYSLTFAFDVPLESFEDPMPIQFPFCLASHFSAKRGFTGWALGNTEAEEKKRSPRTSMEMYLALLNEGEEAAAVPGVDGISWNVSNFNANALPTIREMCTRMLRAKYMWK